MADHILTFTVDKTSEALLLMAQIDARMEAPELEIFMRSTVAPWIQYRIKQRFTNEGDDVSGKWPALSPATVSIREWAGYPGEHPINVRTGDMKDFLTTDAGKIGSNTDWVTLEYPSDNMDSELQSKIETAQKGKIDPQTPPRPVLGLGYEDEAVITADLAGYIMAGVSASGGRYIG